MDFEIIGEITQVETIATGKGVKNLRQLVRNYGKGRWRKLKGIALIRVASGEAIRAEIHWYEAHGVGRRKFKIKKTLW
ncbi:MAG: hypothetical protein ACRD16_02125 [Thermoanaerobaculia bacterium]